ncbi:MAG: hypothetical protein N4A63_14870 [Vallitalea sp.]|jgi:hypothetical protein|nr:hypothetical protein [Vallitalea sp.]
MKKLSIIILSIALITSSMPVLASETKKEHKFDIVKAKIELKEMADREVYNLKKTNSYSIRKEINPEKLVTQLYNNQKISSKDAEEILKANGIYKLNIPKEYLPATKSMDTGDVSMTEPWITYDSHNNEWIVTCGGYWENADYSDGIGKLWAGYVGEIKNVGGRDGFGVGFTSTTGTYKTYVKRSYAQISDGEGNIETTDNRTDGNGEKGFGFQFQDYAKCYKVELAKVYYTYIGKHFGGSCVYDKNFTEYDGCATTYYRHTYNKAKLNSVSFGVSGKTAGVEFSITNEQYSLPPIFSNDTRF